MADSSRRNEIAHQAEADANTYQAKTGAARKTGLDNNADVGSSAEQKFPDASILYNEDLTMEVHGTETPHKPSRVPEQTGELPPIRAAPPKSSLGPAGDVATEGARATHINVGSKPPGVGGSQFKGENYIHPESVPDSISAEGLMPPESMVQASRESELCQIARYSVLVGRDG